MLDIDEVRLDFFPFFYDVGTSYGFDPTRISSDSVHSIHTNAHQANSEWNRTQDMGSRPMPYATPPTPRWVLITIILFSFSV